ncbi:MAG: hypothetical protein E6356_13915 [Terrisporobacter othiniensis]|nr:hypothetical protein [Terrisporobacter othiniensis]
MESNIRKIMEQSEIYIKDDIIVSSRYGRVGMKYTWEDILISRIAVIEENGVFEILHNGGCILKDLRL